MPAPLTHTLTWQDATFEFDAAGTLRHVTHQGRLLVLTLGLAGVDIAGTAHRPVVEEVTTDPDEVGHAGRCGPLRWRSRHGFDRTWSWRMVLENPTEEPIRVARVHLDARGAHDTVTWAHAAGAWALLTFPVPGGPLLGLRLTRGDVRRDDDWLMLSDLVLEPGQQYLITWSGQWYATPRELAATQPGWFPATLTATGREPILIRHPDAVITENGRTAEPVDGVVEVAAEGVGPVDVRVADAAGVTRLRVAAAGVGWDIGAEEARRVLGAGVRTDAEAIVLQHHRAGTGDPAAVEAALAEYLDRPSGPLTPLRIPALIAEHQRTGDPDLVDRALTVFAEVPLTRGAGLALTSIWTTANLTGLGEDPRLAAGLARIARARPEDRLFAAELGVIRGGDAAAAGTAYLELGLGRGLLGAPLPQWSPARSAYACAVLSFGYQLRGLPPAEVEATWPAGAAEVLARAEADIRCRVATDQLTARFDPGPDQRAAQARLAAGDAARAAAWLALSEH